VLLALGSVVLAQPSGMNITCRAIDSTQVVFCAGVVNWMVPSYINDTVEDFLAEQDSDVSQICCPFFVTDNYQCIKHFPRCEMESVNHTLTAVVTKICTSACLFGQQYMDGECSVCTQSFWTQECDDPFYYASPPAPCQNAGDFDTGSTAQTWKWVLVGIMCGIALVIFLVWIRYKCRERMSMEDLDKEYERKSRKAQLKNADRYDDVADEDHTPQQILGRGHPPTAEELAALEVANRAEAEEAAARKGASGGGSDSGSGGGVSDGIVENHAMDTVAPTSPFAELAPETSEGKRT